MTTTNTTQPKQHDQLTMLLLARCAALCDVLETAAREAVAGNGHSKSMKALSEDDRAQERQDALVKGAAHYGKDGAR